MLEQRIASLQDRLRRAAVIDNEAHRHRDRRRRRGRPRQGPEVRQVAEVPDRRLRRGQPGRAQALERVSDRQGAGRQQEERGRDGGDAARPQEEAQGHEDRTLSATGHVIGGGAARATCIGGRWARPMAHRLRRDRRAGRQSDLLADRRAKLERLREEGIEPFPHGFPDRTEIAAVRESHADIEPGEETERPLPDRRPAHRAPGPRQGGLPRPEGRHRADPGPGAGRRARRRPTRACSRSTSATSSASREPSSPRSAASSRSARTPGSCSRRACGRRRRSSTASRTSRPATGGASST